MDVVVSRDEQIVSWLGRIGAAGAVHVSERFDMCRSLAYIRLAQLTAGGLLDHRLVLADRPGVYTATREGLRWQGLARLPICHTGPAVFEHTWHMACTAVALHEHLPGWQLLAEREILALQNERAQLVTWVRVGNAGSRPTYRRPDFALVSPSGRVTVVEVELVAKERARLERICRAWTRGRHIDHVYYLALPSAARAVKRASEAVGATEIVTVLELNDVPGLAQLERKAELGRDGGKAEEKAQDRARLAGLPTSDGARDDRAA